MYNYKVCFLTYLGIIPPQNPAVSETDNNAVEYKQNLLI